MVVLGSGYLVGKCLRNKRYRLRVSVRLQHLYVPKNFKPSIGLVAQLDTCSVFDQTDSQLGTVSLSVDLCPEKGAWTVAAATPPLAMSLHLNKELWILRMV